MKYPHPTPEAIREAMDRLETVTKDITEPLVDMNVGDVWRPMGSCRTVACHGGWYALAKAEQAVWMPSKIDGMDGTVAKEVGYEHHLDYGDGAEQLAEDLGFDNAACLRRWSRDNPELWGNEYGTYMFATRAQGTLAFDMDPFEPFPVKVVIDHWRKVADRIEALS